MRATISPSFTRKSTLFNAFRPPKFMVSCFISSTGSMSRPPGVITVKMEFIGAAHNGKDHGRFDKIETGGIDDKYGKQAKTKHDEIKIDGKMINTQADAEKSSRGYAGYAAGAERKVIPVLQDQPANLTKTEGDDG